MLYIALRCGCDALEPAAAGSLPAELGEHRPAIAKCLSEQPLARHRTAGELADALGLHEAVTGGESAPEHFRDCPVCRLKSEIRSDSLRRGRPSETRGEESMPLVTYAWAVALALAVACMVVWWFALK